MKNKEEWRDVTGYEGLYQVSNLGRVKSFPCPGNYGRSGIRTPITHYKGYKWLYLSKDKEKHNFKIHRLVAMAFIPNPNNYPQVNHKNGIKDDNYVENLEWCNNSQNIQHAYDTGLAQGKGEKHFRSKFKDEDIKKIRNLKLSQSKIAKRYGVCKSTIQCILVRRTWKHIL
jgi:hypothetical protein